jgi:hypothetical protein
MQLGTFLLILFCLPETLFCRSTSESASKRATGSSISKIFTFKRPDPSRSVRFRDFIRPIAMLRYLPITLPGLYYMTAFGYGSVIFATTGSQLFREFYGFTTSQTGLMLSVPLLIGCLIGEANAGWIVDYMVVRHAKRHNGEKLPEARLNLLWLGLLVPVGLIIEGVCLSKHETVHWVGSAFGMGIANLGLQVGTTVVYAYTTDVSAPSRTRKRRRSSEDRYADGSCLQYSATSHSPPRSASC